MRNSFEQKIRYLRPGIVFRFKDNTKPETGVYECVTVGYDPRDRDYIMYIHKNLPDNGIKRIHGDEAVSTETQLNSYDEASPRITTIGSLYTGAVVLVFRQQDSCVTEVRKLVYKQNTITGEVEAVSCSNGETYPPHQKVRILYPGAGREYKRVDECVKDELFHIRDLRVVYSPWNTYGIVNLSWEGGVCSRVLRKYDFTLDEYEGPEFKLAGDIVVLRSNRIVGASRKKYPGTTYTPPAPIPDPVYEDILVEVQPGNKAVVSDLACDC